MKNKYNEVMERIEVTPEIQERILDRLQKLDWEQEPNKTRFSFSTYRRYIAIAACFMFLLAGSLIIHHATQTPSDPPVMVKPNIVEFNSVQNLSKAVGFTMRKPEHLPFIVDSVQYTAYWNELGQVTYTGEANSVVFRMSSGNEEVSGDYAEYTSIKDLTINGNVVTMKGTDHQYVLALWQSDGFSYSVQFTKPVSEQELKNTVESVR
ncbi:hypothetical protein [Paenibacillus sp. 22594]|uniref:hypothetical protein n=1 Tax=Paenibacillus sp. 22594 TaxID=3453947 RepID=UPI003F8300F4